MLRPLPAGAKLTDGAIQDVGNNRLIALPKKVFPKSGKDRFMAFVEKEKASMETLKEEFFAGSEYSTKTTGTRQTPNITPIGEGVYAITRTGGGQGTTHMAYMLTIPSEVGEVQQDIGLSNKGSFVLSVKNPESSAPSYALPNAADFSKEILDEFGGRGWMPAEPKHLDYINSAFLLIGENFDSSSNLEPTAKDEKDDTKETPQEELLKLEGEDEQRVENLKGKLNRFPPFLRRNPILTYLCDRRRYGLRRPGHLLKGIPQGHDNLVELSTPHTVNFGWIYAPESHLVLISSWIQQARCFFTIL